MNNGGRLYGLPLFFLSAIGGNSGAGPNGEKTDCKGILFFGGYNGIGNARKGARGAKNQAREGNGNESESAQRATAQK